MVAVGALIAGGVAIWGLHRLGIHWEERGWINYRRRGCGGGIPAGLMELQRALEPRVTYTQNVEDERREKSENEAPGQGSPGQGDGSN